MFAKTRFALIILAFALTNVKAEYDVKKYCQLVPKGTKLPSLKSCQTYYICSDFNQVTELNCQGTYAFDKDYQTCIPKKDSSCKLGVSNPCEDLHDTFASDAKDCRLWHYCSNGIILGSGLCPTGQHFNGKMCIHGNCNNNIFNNDGVGTDVRDLCKIMKNGEFFGDFNHCATWQKCTANKGLIKGNCTTGLVYDVEKRMCVKSERNTCARSTTVGPITPPGSCANGDKRGDINICSIYYLCNGNKWTKIECKRNEYFDTIDKKCKERQKASPEKTCDRCQFSTYKWVNDIDGKCTKYYTCKDGQRIGEWNGIGSCGENRFFNEQMQVCVNSIVTLDYAKNNGACRCDRECKLDACNDNSICKEQVCNAETLLEDQVNCRILICKDNKCKNTACMIYGNPEKIKQCKLDICENEDCKIQVECETKLNQVDRVNCEVKLCKDEECKNKTCEKHVKEDDKLKCRALVKSGKIVNNKF